MVDMWFVAGIALGTLVTGFCAIGSYERGRDSVRRGSWSVELGARKRALVASRATARQTAPVTIPEGAFAEAS
jgi:hypothetical protein